MNGVDAIQPYNIFRVNPVNVFENNQRKNGAESFNSSLFAQQSNGNYNPNHPDVKGGQGRTGFLDLLA